MRTLLAFFIFVLLMGVPAFVGAHEVYLLEHDVIVDDLSADSPNPFEAIEGNMGQFLFWAFISILTVSTVFAMSVFRKFEKRMLPMLRRLKHYAPLSARVTLGAALIACAYNQALFGPELAFSQLAGAWAPMLSGLFYILGAFILFGYRTRAASLITLGVFAFAITKYGLYMTNYANYLGEILVLAILGGHSFAVHTKAHDTARHQFQRLARSLEGHAFFIMRVGFGVAVIFAALYAKFWYSALALQTVVDYNLTAYFPFEPLFIVLGAFIIEVLIGLFLIFGIALRWTALFFLFWLALSLLYFGEAVWPHLILIGLNITVLLHGYDRYTLEGRFWAARHREPIL